MTPDTQLQILTTYLDAHNVPTDYPYDGGVEGPTPDLFVSESEARYRQRAVDDVLSERWSA